MTTVTVTLFNSPKQFIPFLSTSCTSGGGGGGGGRYALDKTYLT